MDNATHFFARQPLLDREEQIFGYEFFYRDAQGNNTMEDPRSATAAVLVNLLNQIGLHKSAADALLFINVDDSILQSDILFTLPPERFVFEVPATTSVTAKIRERLTDLHRKGYRFAVDNATCDPKFIEKFTPLFPFVDYIKFNTMATDMEELTRILPYLKGKKLIAQRVEIPEVFEAYREIGFDYFQGYFFARLHLIQHNRIDPKHLGVIRIYNMLLSDMPLPQIADEFKRHNELSMQFLQYLTSTGLVSDAPSRSLEELLEKVGPARLEQWLMMIIYSKSSRKVETEKSPLSLLIEQRIDIMTTVIGALDPLEKARMCDQARLCAFVSLMDTVLNVPMSSVLQQVKVSEEVEEALLSHSGKLGRIFALALAVEKDDYAAAQVLLKALKLPPDLLPKLQELKKV